MEAERGICASPRRRVSKGTLRAGENEPRRVPLSPALSASPWTATGARYSSGSRQYGFARFSGSVGHSAVRAGGELPQALVAGVTRPISGENALPRRDRSQCPAYSEAVVLFAVDGDEHRGCFLALIAGSLRQQVQKLCGGVQPKPLTGSLGHCQPARGHGGRQNLEEEILLGLPRRQIADTRTHNLVGAHPYPRFPFALG